MDVTSPAFIENPYPFYEARRSQSPIIKRDAFTWAITGYDIMSKVLTHPLAGRGNVGQTPRQFGDDAELEKLRADNPALVLFESWMLVQNPPAHTASRKRVADVFTVKMIALMEEFMRDVMQRLMLEIKQKFHDKEFDLISEIAYPFPTTVICEIVGIPQEDRDRFTEWTQDISLAAQLDFHSIPPDVRLKVNRSAVALNEYFQRIIPSKINKGGDDLISKVLDSNESSVQDLDIVSMCVMLLFAGQDTTTCMVGNIMHALLSNPAQLLKLKADPALAKNAVEESLRYDPSVQMAARMMLDDVEIDGLKLKKGDHLFAFLGAAGRDPAVNSNPHQFDITREKIKHLAFARGLHHCLGASLARLELKVMLEELIAGFPDLLLAGQAKRRNTWMLRGFESLPVKF